MMLAQIRLKIQLQRESLSDRCTKSIKWSDMLNKTFLLSFLLLSLWELSWHRRSQGLSLQARSLLKLRLAPILLPAGSLNWLASTLLGLADLPRHPIPLIDQYSYWFQAPFAGSRANISIDLTRLEKTKRLPNQFRCNLPTGYDSELHGDFQPGLDLMSVNCGIDTAVGLYRSVANQVTQYVNTVVLAL